MCLRRKAGAQHAYTQKMKHENTCCVAWVMDVPLTWTRTHYMTVKYRMCNWQSIQWIVQTSDCCRARKKNGWRLIFNSLYFRGNNSISLLVEIPFQIWSCHDWITDRGSSGLMISCFRFQFIKMNKAFCHFRLLLRQRLSKPSKIAYNTGHSSEVFKIVHGHTFKAEWTKFQWMESTQIQCLLQHNYQTYQCGGVLWKSIHQLSTFMLTASGKLDLNSRDFQYSRLNWWQAL